MRYWELSEELNESNKCFNCGNYRAEDEDVCQSCGFDLASVIKCPYKEDNNICSLTKTSCISKGMEWEICEILREGGDN